MSNYEEEDEEDDELLNEEPAPAAEVRAARSTGSRNFVLALGILGAIFLCVIAVLAYLYFTGPRGTETSDISATNAAIETANAQTAIAATLTSVSRSQVLATDTPQASATPVPAQPSPTSVLAQPSPTSVLAQPTVTNTGAAATAESAPGALTPTANAQTQTQSAPAVLTQSARSTQTRQAAANLTATATALPKTGIAEDMRLPGLIGLALGLILIIILVRRLRFSTGS